MHPTPYSDLNQVLSELTSGIRDALGEALVAAYLQGSFAVGDFDADSDVDFVVVTAHEPREGEVEVLQLLHSRIYELDCPWAQHLEGSYFPEDVIRSCDRRGHKLWYLNHGSSFLVRSEHCNTAVVRWIVHECGVVLLGPPPTEILDQVPVGVLRREIWDTIHDWGREILSEAERFENRFYQSFIVLSYCKMLRDLEAGRIGSKLDGAEWAKETLDPSWADLIDGAWGGRKDPAVSVRQPPDPDDFTRTLRFVEYAIQKAPFLLDEVPGDWQGGHR